MKRESIWQDRVGCRCLPSGLMAPLASAQICPGLDGHLVPFFFLVVNRQRELC